MSYQEEKLTEIADAIREKTGKDKPIQASQFANEIKNINPYINPTWWDIETILREDTYDTKYKAICLLNDYDDILKKSMFSSDIFYKFSDREEVVSGESIDNGGYVWDKTKDKPCYDKDGKYLYSTRYYIIYASNIRRLVIGLNDYNRFSLIYCVCSQGNIDLFSISHSSNEYSMHNFTYPLIGYKTLDGEKIYAPLNGGFSCSSIVDDMFKLAPQNGNLNNTQNIIFTNCRNIYSLKNIFGRDEINTGTYIELNYCGNLRELPKLNLKNNTNIHCAYCTNLKEFIVNNGANVEISGCNFDSDNSLVTLKTLNLAKVTYFSSNAFNLRNIQNLELLNIHANLQVGSGNQWGHLLTIESLIGISKELVKKSSSRTLTIGSTNKDKLENVYVRFIDPTQETIDEGEKGEIEICESTDERAMTISQYLCLKLWNTQ